MAASGADLDLNTPRQRRRRASSWDFELCAHCHLQHVPRLSPLSQLFLLHLTCCIFIAFKNNLNFHFCFLFFFPASFLHFESAEAQIEAEPEAAPDSHCQMSLLMHDLDFRTAYDDVRRMTKDWIDPCTAAPLPLLLLCSSAPLAPHTALCFVPLPWRLCRLRHAKICNEGEEEQWETGEACLTLSLCCQFSISFSCELLTTIVAAVAAKMRPACSPLTLPARLPVSLFLLFIVAKVYIKCHTRWCRCRCRTRLDAKYHPQ